MRTGFAASEDNMKKLLRAGLVATLAIVLFGAYRHASAEEGRSARGSEATEAPVSSVDNPVTLATKHVLQATYVNSGNYGDVLVTGGPFVPVDTQLTVLCPGTSGTCSIQADMLVENGGASSPLNTNSVCLIVDGSPGNSCSFAEGGEVPSDQTYTGTTNFDIVTGLTHGNHTVQMYFQSRLGAFVARYHVNYHVYKP
jgi:hypothetical protein